MIEIKTDWSIKNTSVFQDGVFMHYVTGFKIIMGMDGPKVEITKFREKDGRPYVEKAGTDEAFLPFETLTFSDFNLSLL